MKKTTQKPGNSKEDKNFRSGEKQLKSVSEKVKEEDGDLGVGSNL